MADEKKVERLFNLQRRFFDGAQLTISRMMEDYGINRRTANRDLNGLRELGVELESEMGPDGQKIWRVEKRHRKVTLEYNISDLMTLFMGRRLFDFLAGTELEASMEKIYAKIEDRLEKTKDLARSRELSRKVHMIGDGPKKLTGKKKTIEWFDEIFTGLVDEKKVQVVYQDARGKVSKWLIHPYTLVAYKRGLYFLSYVEELDEMRTLAVERFRKARFQRGSIFEYPTDFDPETHFKDAFFMKIGNPTRVELVFTSSTEPFIGIRQFHHSQKVSRLRDGRLSMILDIPADPGRDYEIINWLMGFGPNVEVISPLPLREAFRSHVEKTLARYR